MNGTRTPLLATAAVVLAVAGCSGAVDAGPERTEDRSVGAVTRVELATSGTLRVTPGDAPALRVTAGENVLRDLTSEVEDGTLVLGTDRSVGGIGDARYDLVLPELQALDVSGSGDATVGAPSALREVRVEGSGDVTVEGLTVAQLTVDVSGSGTVTAQGSADTQTVSLEGSGDYDGTGLQSRDAQVTVAGSGRADVEVTGALTAVVEGSGTITHSGGATVDSRVDGSGEVRAR